MSRKPKSTPKAKDETAPETSKVKHMFDPACECADCISKRGMTFQYVHPIPNLPDGIAGIYTEGEGPDDAMRKHLHELELVRLGVGKGRRELRQEADAIHQVPYSEADGPTSEEAVNAKLETPPADSTATPPGLDPTRFRRGPDYADCIWNGERHTFAPAQRACVKVLWEAFANGTPEVGQSYVLEKAGLDSQRLQDVFKGNGAWKKMIVKGSAKDTFCLAEPT